MKGPIKPTELLSRFESRLVAWNESLRAHIQAQPSKAALAASRTRWATQLDEIEALLPPDVRQRSGVKLWDAFSNYVQAVSAWLDGCEASDGSPAAWLSILEEGVDDAWEECERALSAPFRERHFK